MMLIAGSDDSYSPRRHWCYSQPDFGSMGLGAYRSLMTFGNAEDVVCEFATYIEVPGATHLNRSRDVSLQQVICSLRVGLDEVIPTFRIGSNPKVRVADNPGAILPGIPN